MKQRKPRDFYLIIKAKKSLLMSRGFYLIGYRRTYLLDGAAGAETLMSIFSFLVPPKNPL